MSRDYNVLHELCIGAIQLGAIVAAVFFFAGLAAGWFVWG